MRISWQSGCYLAANVLISAYNAYSMPVPWISTFTLGAIAGTFFGARHFRQATEGSLSSDKFGAEKANADKDAKQKAVYSLTSSMPGFFTMAINLFALGLISKYIQIPSNINLQYVYAFYGFAFTILGIQLGQTLQMTRLRHNQDPYVQDLIRNMAV